MRGWKPPAVHASPTTGPRDGGPRDGRARLYRSLGLALGAAALAAISGAFGSGQAAWAPRVGFWIASMGSGAALGAAAGVVFERQGWSEGPFLRTWALYTVTVATPLTVVVWALAGWLLAGRLAPHALPGFALPVLAVSAVMSFLTMRLERAPLETHTRTAVFPGVAAGADAETAPPAVRFLDRLPQRLRGADMHAVEAQDHYLRLHTSRGSELILLRLSDAMAELDGVEGAQTHRSWWVAKAAVEGARRNDGRATLILPGGVEAPVSRSYVKALRDAGWF